jgi:ACS family D-galactonate transporter-like MFS transporter
LWLLQVSGSYAAPMQVIFVFLLIGALATVFLLRPEWAPKLREPVCGGVGPRNSDVHR